MDLPILNHLLTRIDQRTCSLRDLSTQSGVPYDTLCKIAQRKQVPRLDTAEKLLKVWPIERNTSAEGTPEAETAQATGIAHEQPLPDVEAAGQGVA